MKNFNTIRFSIIVLVIIFSALQTAFGQSGVVISRLPGTADPSALLDIVSDGNPSWKGLLIPRMTAADRTGISNPATGLLVFQTDGTPGFYYNAGTPAAPNWVVLSAGAISGVGLTNQVARWTTPSILGTGVIYDDATNVGIGTTTPNQKLEVNGAIKYGNTASTCNATTRGTTKFVAGGVGAGDCVYQCMKLPDETYSWTVIKCPGVKAIGGTVTTVGSFRVHTFTSSGTFSVIDGGNVEVLVVAGGGGGGGAGGGGGGGVISNTSYAVTGGQTINVTVGAGGAGATTGTGTVGAAGGSSVFGTITATGGGGGGGYNGGNGGAGGSGGGGGSCNTATAGSGTGGQGNNGGTGSITCSPYTSGGGGGGGAVGGSASGANSGNGGAGIQNNIDGNNYYYGGGGGGGSQGAGRISGNGGLGGGGGGAQLFSGTAGVGGGSARSAGGNGQQVNSYPPCDGGAGGANTGGGGGGMGISVSNGGAGGSGIVIVRYQF